MYSKWYDAWRNVMNFEHWWNNMLVGYQYAIGIFCLPIIIIALIVDTCIKPLLGRSPNAQRRKKGEVEQNNGHDKKKHE